MGQTNDLIALWCDERAKQVVEDAARKADRAWAHAIYHASPTLAYQPILRVPENSRAEAVSRVSEYLRERAYERLHEAIIGQGKPGE